MTYHVILPVIIAFAVSALLGPVVIPFLRRLKVGQTERKELESHQKKMGTPTMGGCNQSDLCKRLSEDYSDSLYGSRIWRNWIFR